MFNLQSLATKSNETWVTGNVAFGRANASLTTFEVWKFELSQVGAFPPPGKHSDSDYIANYEGVLHVTNVLSGKVKLYKIPFIWAYDYMVTDYKSSAAQMMSSTVLCRINSEKPLNGNFDPIYAIPHSWTNYVRDATTFIKQHPSLIKAKYSGTRKYIDLLNCGNPVLEIAAFKNLPSVTANNLITRVSLSYQHTGIELAAMLHFLKQVTPGPLQSQLMTAITNRVQNTTPEQLVGIALFAVTIYFDQRELDIHSAPVGFDELLNSIALTAAKQDPTATTSSIVIEALKNLGVTASTKP